MKKIVILTILMLAMGGLMSGCAHHQTLQRCQERHGEPAKVVQGEGDMVTWYYHLPGRRGYTTVMEVVGNTRTGMVHEIKKYSSKQQVNLPNTAAQPRDPSEDTLKKKAPPSRKKSSSENFASLTTKKEAPTTTQKAPSPSYDRPGQFSIISQPSGFYSLDTLIDFDTLDEVTYNPIRGTLSLSGRRLRSGRQMDLHYLNLLATALDSNKPVLSLEWTPSSQREVDRAMAYFSDDRNNDEITTKLSKIFDAKGRLNRKGALFFKALGANVHEGMDKYEFNASLLAAAGYEKAGAVLKAFGAMVEAIKRNDRKSKYLEDLAEVLGLYDYFLGFAEKYQAGQMTMSQVIDTVYPKLLDELAKSFGWNGSRYVEKYRSLRRAGRSYEYAGDEALYDFQNDLNTLPRKMIDALTSKVSEVLLPSEIMKEVLGAEPRVRPVLTGLPDKSQLAWVAFQADVFCKGLFDMPDLKAKVPKYQTYFEWLRAKRQRPVTGGGHLWISPGDFEIFESADGNTLRFGRTPMIIHIEKYLPGRKSVPDTQLSEYANLLTACYDDIAREYYVLHQLRECTKMVAVAHWLKKRGFSLTLPIEGRERMNLPAEVPGALYMVMAIKQASVGQILIATGGIDFSGDSGWRYTRKEMQSPQGDFVELTIQQTREKVEQIFRKKIDVPVPRPMGGVTSTTTGGQKVTTVTVSTASNTGGTSPVRLRRSREEQAAFLWRSDDLDKAEQAYRKLIESCSDDSRYCASLRMVLAQVLHEKGDNAAAIKELNEAVRVAPDLPIIQLLYAEMLFDSGDLRRAEEALQKYISLDPNNKAAVNIRAEIQARQKKPVEVTSTPSTSVSLTPFSQAVGQVSISLLGDVRAPDLKDIRIEPFKPSGRDRRRPVEVPKKLAETEGWKKLKAEDDKLMKDYMEIDRKLEEIRDKKGRGEGNQNELDKQESQLKQEQAIVKEKIDSVEKEMVGVLVKWEKENPEPASSEPAQPAGDKPSVLKEGEKKP